MRTPQEHGFIALISILIISAVLLATTLSLAQFGIANRVFILRLEEKAMSERLADACVHIARVSAYNDPTNDSTDPTTIEVADGACTINSFSSDGNETTVEVSASSGSAITNYQVVINNTDGTFLSWVEVSAF